MSVDVRHFKTKFIYIFMAANILFKDGRFRRSEQRANESERCTHFTFSQIRNDLFQIASEGICENTDVYDN